ncbi:DNA-binding protein [Roseateles sp. DXS20W]|uniref:DNA-binding protein n=1 Tax=Pelomonas lactea TaxID=3299030 RepID=A0ABW7GPZ0_9BURK
MHHGHAAAGSPMTRSIATEASVWAAADALAAEGTEPTLDGVLARLGGGSRSTAAPHLRTWFARRDELAAVVVPDEVAARGGAFIRELFATAQRLAHEAVDEPHRHTKAALKSANAQLADADAQIARLEKVEQGHLDELARHAERIRELEIGMAAQQAMTQEKTLVIERLDDQLRQVQQVLNERTQEVAALRATAATAEALEGRLETLQRSVQGLSDGRAV